MIKPETNALLDLGREVIRVYNTQPYSDGNLANLVIKLATLGLQILPVKNTSMPKPIAIMQQILIDGSGKLSPNWLAILDPEKCTLTKS